MDIRPYRGWTLALLLAAGSALAQGSGPAGLPEWDQLTAQQREALVAPLRERWNQDPSQRARMLGHAQRWQSMSPEQRGRARKGMRHFEGMDPVQRQQARALFQRMRTLEPKQRDALRAQWKAMTPEQRSEWVEQNPPGAGSGSKPGP